MDSDVCALPPRVFYFPKFLSKVLSGKCPSEWPADSSPFGRAECHHLHEALPATKAQLALPLYAHHPLATLHRGLLGWVMHKYPSGDCEPFESNGASTHLDIGSGSLGSRGVFWFSTYCWILSTLVWSPGLGTRWRERCTKVMRPSPCLREYAVWRQMAEINKRKSNGGALTTTSHRAWGRRGTGPAK